MSKAALKEEIHSLRMAGARVCVCVSGGFSSAVVEVITQNGW